MGIQLRRMIKYLGVALIVIMLCVLLLTASAFLPQGRIHRNIEDSTKFLLSEGVYAHIGDKSESSQLDNWTDLFILKESDALRNGRIENLLICPLYVEESEDVASAVPGYSQMSDDYFN